MRFIVNLMPQLEADSKRLSRVVSVLGAGGESPLVLDDLQLKRNYSMRNCANHAITMTSLSMGMLACAHPFTSFIHTYPGVVNTNLTRDMGTVTHIGAKALLSLVSRWLVPLNESGQRHLYVSTSKKYLPLSAYSTPHSKYDDVGLGTAAAYLVDHRGFPRQNLKLLDRYHANGTAKKVWKHTIDVFAEVCGDEPTSK